MRDPAGRVAKVWLWGLGALAGVVVIFVLVVGPWLFVLTSGGALTAEQELKARNDVRTTLVQALGGLAIAGGLIVTFRTYRQNREEQDRSYQLRKADQINELYTKGVEQLGSEKAPVRLGALYSLERLAQENTQHRPAVVDVFCAYLRMPFQLPGDPETAEDRAQDDRLTQEVEVRRTVQTILGKHLQPQDPGGFWPDTVVNLSGAVLINLNLRDCRMRSAQFLRTSFRGRTVFYNTIFDGDTTFAGADLDPSTGAYTGRTYWYGAEMGFDGAHFNGPVSFFECRFRGRVTYNEVTFHGNVDFSKAQFAREPPRPGAEERYRVGLHRARVAPSAKTNWPKGWASEQDPDDPSLLYLNFHPTA